MTTKGVYCLTFPNGKRYVGVGNSHNGIHGRWSMYRNLRCKDQPRLFNALLKYGSDNVKYEVIINTEDATLSKKIEVQLIALWCLQSPKYGYNISKGGDFSTLGLKLSQSHRDKISEAGKGRKHTPETILKMIASAKARGPRSEETCAKISASKLGIKSSRPMSEESKRKLSLSKKGKKRPPFSAEWRANLSKGHMGSAPTPGMKGKKHTMLTREKLRQSWVLRRMKL